MKKEGVKEVKEVKEVVVVVVEVVVVVMVEEVVVCKLTCRAFMASSSVRSSPANMTRMLSLQATPNPDLRMWMAALP